MSHDPDDARPTQHLAQLNIGTLRAGRDDPLVAEFMAALDPINALADASPGFVWRLETPEGNATALRPYDDDRILVNLSVWQSLDTLRAFVYRSAHTDVMRRRREWFERYEGSYMVLWWVPAGHLPSVDEATARLELLERHGPGPGAFTFQDPFPSPRSVAIPAERGTTTG